VICETSLTEQQEISRFLTIAFRAWERAGIDFLVLRNYEGLPETISNDIDVLVSPRQAREAEMTLRTAASEAGFRLHNRAEFSTLALYFSSASGAEAHIDIFRGLQWRAFDFLSCERFLLKRIKKGLFSIPHPAHEAATSLLATMIYTGEIKEKYKTSIVHGFKTEPEEAHLLLAQTYGETLATFVVEAGTAQEWERLRAATGSLRRSMIVRQFFGRPLKTVSSLVTNGWRILRRFFRPPGLSVVLCGADGSGKSTVGTNLINALNCTFPPPKGRRFHWKPPVFSAARQAARGLVDDPHGKPPRNPVASLLYFAFHWMEFFIGSHVRIRPVTFRGGLVLIDRYYYDFLVDQRRYRLQLPHWLVRLGLAFLKQPDLVVLLDAPAEVLHKRKQEVELQETQRQREAYLEMIRTLPNGRTINADQSPDGVVRDIKKLILDFMLRRMEKR
jgi:thymidylate kinase